MTWFDALTGFSEDNPQTIYQQLTSSLGMLHSAVNGKKYHCGTLTTPSLQELRHQFDVHPPTQGTLHLDEVVGDARALHAAPANAGACFQVASQFNLLEMASPKVTPEAGVGIYEMDHTQGPACAVACGAGTIYRNYFVPVNGQTGQSATRQINCLKDLAHALGENIHMQNGYAFADETTLFRISEKIRNRSSETRNHLRGCLRVGLQADTEVTLPHCGHRVHQVYGSALPVGYSDHDPDLWEPFARLVLEASYEACIKIALLQNCKTLFLTLLGGGVFGNRIHWITDAILRAAHLHRNQELQVNIVSYGSSKPEIKALVQAENA
ncbi:hypothetical protein P0Y35_11580 [Kiritimatiellaeota bacterium B1221]|nr:hypothetical protein [Kiritimatiellaeota bacterium B1221]